MNLLTIFRKSSPGRDLANLGHRNRRELIRSTVDHMRSDMGQPPVAWPRGR